MRFVFLTCLYVIHCCCIAQSSTTFPVFTLKEIIKKENLCDPFVITIAQDNDGLMWAGTNTGLNRLDGYTVKNFFFNPTKTNGLSNNTITDLNAHFNNKLFVGTGNGICYYDYTTKKINRIFSDTNKVLYPIFIPAKDKLLAISNIDGSWHAIDKNNTLTNLHYKLDYNAIEKQIKTGVPFSTNKSNLHHWTFIGSCLVNINLNSLTIQDAVNLGDVFKTYHIHSIVEDGNYLWISTWGKGLVRYNLITKELVYLTSKYIYNKHSTLFKDANNKTWVITTHENGYAIVDPATLALQDYEIGASAYTVFVDKQNTIWFGTNNGLFYAENKKPFVKVNEVFDNYISPNTTNKTEKTLPWNLYSTNEYYFIPLTNKKAMLQFDKTWNCIKYYEPNKNAGKPSVLAFEYISGIYEKNNFYWIITYNGLVKCKKDFTPIKWFYANVPDAKKEETHELRNLIVLNNNNILFKSNYGIHYFDTNKETFINTFTATKNNANNFPDEYVAHIAAKNELCYFIVHHKGLYQLNLRTGTTAHIPLPYNNVALSKVVVEGDNVWIGSYNGLIKYNTKTKLAKTYLQQDGLFNDFIVGLTLSKTNMLWMVTASSISCLDTKTDAIKNFYKKTGLSGGNAYGEKINIDDNDNIVFGIRNYIGFINKEILDEVEQPKKSIITALLINNKDTLWQLNNNEKYISLPSTQNSISIHFAMENTEENNTYFYKLNNEWRSTTSGQIDLAGLAPGTYIIHVANQPKDNAVNDFITITIRQPFYNTWWFIAVCAISIGGILYAFFKAKANSIRKQALLQKTYNQKLVESEMQTLRSQMNPHFMFNTLNSINSYIIQHKTDLASAFLTTFSKLMRSILDLSKHETVALSKEIAALKMYIELEALRLENKFDYSIRIDQQIDEESTTIPSLIIQPFVENAIWHGLHSKSTQGTIFINVTETAEQQLVITIEDDGIGRKASAAMKNNQVTHTSHGIDITINRVKLLNNNNSVTFTDLYDEHNIAAGTRVTIILNTV